MKLENRAPKTLIILLARGAAQGTTERIAVNHGDKVIYANATEPPSVVSWSGGPSVTGSPFAHSSDHGGAPIHVGLGDPLTFVVGNAETTPAGVYSYVIETAGAAASAGPGVGDGGGGGEIIIQS